MKYGYAIQLIREDDGELCWVARSESLNGCIGTGATQGEAVRELEENEIAWLETAEEMGLEIPPVAVENAEEEYSGKFTVRTSPFEHRRAAEEAKKQGLSLNQYVGNAIANYNAEVKAAGYISEKVAETARVIRMGTLMETSYSAVQVGQSRLPDRLVISYKQ